ncbi:MAG: TRAP transporter substrate-binding protein DctP, partial [Candidatus Eisenbacteria bacterium]|nr:TRAP transporter substrate-binding protein DctP [Candidatus Eisenbacteria bacterium]
MNCSDLGVIGRKVGARRVAARSMASPGCGRRIGAAGVGLVLALAIGFLLPGGASAQKRKAEYELKIATVAPEGSTWMNVMAELDAQIRERTQGQVGLRFYPGGIQGDDPVVLRKIRTGQLHGGGFTGVGLGEIVPNVRVMETPFFFNSQEEVAAVHQVMDPVFEEQFRAKGFTLLGWAEVGFVYLYSKSPVASLADLRGRKVWLWEGDPLAEAFLRAVGVSAVSLALSDVLTSLQTGLLTTVYISPLACLAMQWHTRTAYVTDIPVTHSLGAVIVTNEAWGKIPEAQRPVVRELCREYFGRLAQLTAEDNRKAAEEIVKAGLKTVAPPPAEIEQFHAIGEKVRADLAGKLY